MAPAPFCRYSLQPVEYLAWMVSDGFIIIQRLKLSSPKNSRDLVDMLQEVLCKEPTSDSAKLSLLSMEHSLQPGVQITAYYSEDHDSEALHRRIEAAMHDLMQSSTAILVEFASHCSTVIYITVVRASADVDMKQLVMALERNSRTKTAPKIFVQYGTKCFFEGCKEGAPRMPQTVATLADTATDSPLFHRWILGIS